MDNLGLATKKVASRTKDTDRKQASSTAIALIHDGDTTPEITVFETNTRKGN